MDEIENMPSQIVLPAWQKEPAARKRPHPLSTSHVNTDDLDCLKIQTVAEIMDVSPQTIRRLINSGKLKAIKVGKNVRVLKWSIDEYVRTYAIESQIALEEKQPRRKTSNGAGYRAALKKAQELGISL